MGPNPETIDGWLFPEEGALLAKYASQAEGSILELGSYKGKSAVYMAEANKSSTIMCVDTFMSDNTTVEKADTLNDFLNNTECYDNVVPFISTTKQMAMIIDRKKSFVSLLFIDADHSYEGVKHDFEAFSNHVTPNGVVIFHDAYGENGEENQTPWPGVTQFCKELEQQGKWKIIEKCRRCAVFQRVPCQTV